MRDNNKEILILSIFTLITALGWVVFDAYHAYTLSTISNTLKTVAIPLTPRIDTQLINDLKSRHNAQQIAGTTPVISTSSANLTATGSAIISTGSGQLATKSANLNIK